MNRHLSGMLLAVGLICCGTGCNLVLNKGAAGNLAIEVLAATALYQTAAVKTQSAALKSKDAPLPTGTATLPPTPTFTPTITLTPTLEKVTVIVSKNTNCRQGPDKFFDLVGIMKVGETAEAIGRNAAKTYWVIRLPANTAKMWYEWATVTGNGDALPIIESPPTPTWSPKPDFTFNYVGVSSCGPGQYIRLQVINTGNVPWESIRVVVEDLVTAASMTSPSNFFVEASGCNILSSIQTLNPGETANSFGNVPAGASGHNLAVKITLFPENGGAGANMTGNFNMTMP